MKTTNIPSALGIKDVQTQRVVEALKNNMDALKGRLNGQKQIASLPNNATTAEIISTVNQILAVLYS